MFRNELKVVGILCLLVFTLQLSGCKEKTKIKTVEVQQKTEDEEVVKYVEPIRTVVDESDANFEPEPRIVNGTYWNGNYNIRVHNQDVVFTGKGKLYQRENLADVNIVFDSFDTKNYLFELDVGQKLHISKIYINRIYPAGTADFWVEVSNGDLTGWLLLAENSRDYYLYYGNGGEKGDYWDIKKYEIVESASGEKRIPFLIPSREVFSKGYCKEPVYLRKEPDVALDVTNVLKASDDENINELTVSYVTAENDDYFYGGQWFYVKGMSEDGFCGGWTKEIKDWYMKSRETGDYVRSDYIIITPAIEIAGYFSE